MRLRPSGQKGPVATKLSSFEQYQASEAWTWEHMALTRARVIAGSPGLRARAEAAIRATLVMARDAKKIATDVRDMRLRIAAEKGTEKIWDLKQVRGGLVDLEFIAQHLQLVHGAAHPEVLDQNTLGALDKLAGAGLMSQADSKTLAHAGRLVHDLTQILRLSLDHPFDPDTAPGGLKVLLARAGGATDFTGLEADLKAAIASVFNAFERIVQ